MHPELHASSARSRWLERALLLVAVVCLAWYALTWGFSVWYQGQARARLERSAATEAARPAEGAPDATAPPPSVPRPAEGDVIGQLDIPRLRLTVAVTEGESDRILAAAAGHLADTPLPWEQGNAALAAHRDTFFRPLKNVAVGDAIRFSSPHGDVEYVVRRTLIVNPDEVWILDPTNRPVLTLVTCYPFSFVGHAPQRFIVQAERVDRSPSMVGALLLPERR